MTTPSGGIIDAHHHFWDPAEADYPWMTGPFRGLATRFGPSDLAPIMASAGVSGTVVVQARQDLAETRSLLAMAEANPWILGVVGWIDLTAADVADTIAGMSEARGPRLVGFRHLVHDEGDPEWLLRPDVVRGLAAVGDAGLVYDLLVRTRELPAATEVGRRLPGLRLVLDHAAKPPIATRQMEPWLSALATIAALSNVTCKVSGLVTEADWSGWRRADLEPYVSVLVDHFGPERLMWGSDWPVCTLAARYGEVLESTTGMLRDLVGQDLRSILRGCAVSTYQLDVPF